MRKIFFIITLLLGILCGIKGENRQLVLSPSDDTYAQRVNTVPATGRASVLPVRRGTDEPLYNRYAILKFNLSASGQTVASEILFRLFFNNEKSGSNIVNNDIERQLVLAELPQWVWTESTLSPYDLSITSPTTAHNQQFKDFVTRLETDRRDISAVKRSTSATGVYWEWNVSDYVHSKISAGDTIVTFLVYESTNTGGSGSSDMYFNSKENTGNHPELSFLSVSENARLQEIILSDDGGGETLLSGFNPYKYNYIYSVQAGNTEIPSISATLSDQGATIQEITQATSLDGTEAERTATVKVIAADGVTSSVYTILFKKGETGTVGESTVKLNLWSSATNKYVRDAQVVRLISGFRKDSLASLYVNSYGSNLRIRTDSTGFYYVKKMDGRWWLIDPDGYAGVNMAVTTINTPANKAMWAYDLLKNIGFNGAGNFISPENLPIKQYNDSSFEKFSYTRRGLGDRGNVGPTTSGGFFQRYQSYRKKFYTFPSGLDNGVYITIMDPEFVSFCDIHASNYVAPQAGERNMLGIFSDNEINFNQDQILFFLRDLSETDPNYQSALSFITSKGISKETVLNNYSSVPTSVKEEYAGVIAEYYYKTVSEAIRKYDPNHLYLGSRLHGRPRGIRQVVEAASRYCDVISVNFYNYPTPKEEIANPVKWGVWTNDKPCLITEFYTKGLAPSGMDLQSGAGYMVQTQQDRATFYQNTCLEVLQSKYYIGWQYFRWMDDDAETVVSNKGIVSPQYTVWNELAASMKELNSQVYPLIDFFDKRTYQPLQTKEVVISPQNDSYITPDEAQKEIIHGQENILVIANSGASSGLSEAFLNFDLGAYKDSLAYIENAKVRLYDASGSNITRNLKIFGVDRTDWSESSFSAVTAGSASEWRSSYGRLRDQEVTPGPETPFLDLAARSWVVSDKASTGMLTFRITDNSNNLQSSVWYSKEQQGKSPELILTMRHTTTTGIEGRPALTPAVKVIQTEGRLEFSGLDRPTICTIYSLSGTCLFTGTTDLDSAVPANFPKGIYLVRLKNEKISVNLKVQMR